MISAVQFFKCLADETRLGATLLIHREGELCVCELMQALGESQSKISRHLAQLRNLRVLQDRRQGQWVYYALDANLPPWARRVLDEACQAHAEPLDRLRSNLHAMQNRPICC